MKRTDSDNKRIVIYVSEATAAWLQRMAERDGCTVSEVVEATRQKLEAEQLSSVQPCFSSYQEKLREWLVGSAR
jgi:uncharacterized protein YdbL (DUF1318 family)